MKRLEAATETEAGTGRALAAPPERIGNSARYAAFISYSHAADGRLAPALQSALHQFAKPFYKVRALQVFRDKADLSASPALWPVLQKALERSDYFILLGSPESAQSIWVKRELDTWLELHNDSVDKILIVWTGGELVWDDDARDFDWRRTTALPELLNWSDASAAPRTLRGKFRHEPFYLDQRWARTETDVSIRNPQFLDEVATIAATLHDKPKIEMIGHDVQQHRAFLLARTIAIGLLLMFAVVAGLAAVYANQRRIEAENERQIAVSRQLSAQSLTLMNDQFDLALLVGIEANRTRMTVESRSVLLGALQRHPNLEAFLQGDTAEVRALEFSPDSRLVASASGTLDRDYTVQLWDVNSHQHVGDPLTGHGPVLSLAFSPDSSILATGGADGAVRLWDTATREPYGVALSGHFGPVQSLAFSPDGKTIASGSPGGRNIEGTPDRGEVRLWDVATGRQLGTPFSGHTSAVYSLAFSPDGKLLASGAGGAIYFMSDRDYSIILWNLRTRRPHSEMFGHASTVSTLAFSPDGKVLASGSYDTSLKAWDVARGEEVAVSDFMSSSFNRHTTPVLRVGFSADPVENRPDLTTGFLMSADADNKVVVSQVGFVQEDSRLRLAAITATRHFDGSIRGVSNVAFSSDRRRWAAGGCQQVSPNGLCERGEISVWRMSPHPSIAEPVPDNVDRVRAVDFAPQGNVFATGGCGELLPADCTGGQVHLWDALTLHPVGGPLKGLHQEVSSLVFSPDGGVVVAGSCGKFKEVGSFIDCHEGEVLFWDARSGMALGGPMPAHAQAVEHLAFSPDGSMMASSDGQTIVLWDAKTRHQTAALRDSRGSRIYSLAFSPDGSTLATGECGRSGPRQGGYESSVSGCLEGAVRFWDTVGRHPIGAPLTGHKDAVTSVAFSPDGKVLASAAGNFDGTIVLWDVGTRQRLGRPLIGHATGIERVVFSGDGRIMASASDGSDARSHEIILWDVETRQAIGQPLRGHSSYIKGIDFSPDGKRLVSAGVDKSVLVWRIDTEAWIESACRIANRQITDVEWERLMGAEPPSSTCSAGRVRQDSR